MLNGTEACLTATFAPAVVPFWDLIAGCITFGLGTTSLSNLTLIGGTGFSFLVLQSLQTK
jgi:hypothetical protein